MTLYSFNGPENLPAQQFLDLVRELAQGAGITLDEDSFGQLTPTEFHFIQTPDLTQQQVNAVQNAIDAWVYVDLVAVEQQAEQSFAGLPGWAHWTVEQAETWHNTNIHDVILSHITTVDGLVTAAGLITNFATALPVLQGMVAEMASMLAVMQKLSKEGREEGVGILSIRNKEWPHLEDPNFGA